MDTRINLPSHLVGLTSAEVIASAKLHGWNLQEDYSNATWWRIVLNILKEPMVILLVVVAVIYFVLGQNDEAYFMIGAILMVTGISFYQDNRSRIALEAIRVLNTPNSRVIRNGIEYSIPTGEIVIGDLVIVDEGGLINADGSILYSHDLSINESTLTGEANAVYKSEKTEDKSLFSGTMISSGMAVFQVMAIGNKTKIGQLGASLTSIKDEKSPLQSQIESFVRKMSIVGLLVFLLVWLVSYLKTYDWIDSLLKGLTLAMSILPEEIPVAFATFMALGSRRLIREGILVKKTRIVETLGGATVICSDKTGTITENKMALQAIYSFIASKVETELTSISAAAQEVIEYAMWASEPVPFDPMEKTIHEVYAQGTKLDKRPAYTMVHEYPLGGIPPMMTHVYQDHQHQNQIVAAKGAPEAIIQVCHLTNIQGQEVNQVVNSLSIRGYRVLGVCQAQLPLNDFPEQQQEIVFSFCGLVAFYDPPKENIHQVFQQFYDAGINIKIITGDNAITTKAIAESAGLRNTEAVINGNDLSQMAKDQQQQVIRKSSIFTRMFPEVKLLAINSLKNQGEIVAMIGDGVNDGPALKAADIGIAMGKKGTEIAKSAADLILLQDDLGQLIHAIAAGRRIYANLKKAVQYIVSIHIPIIAAVSLPVFLGWIYPNIFTPVHVIFLELVMGPTCSIVFENEPMEKNAMIQPPRPISYSFLNWNEMGRSIIQGVIISLGLLFIYQYAIYKGCNEDLTRTLVFLTLVVANIFLTLVNRSAYYSMFESMKRKNHLITIIISLTLTVLVLMFIVPQVRSFFQLALPSISLLLLSLLTATISVFWIEIWKYFIRRRNKPSI